MQSHSTTSDNDAGIEPPSLLYGALFAAIQESGIFADSKTFADAVPLREAQAILAEYLALGTAGPEDLRRFVAANFALPEEEDANPTADRAAEDIAQHIARTWPRLERDGAIEQGSAIGLAHRFVVPGGRFRELYYWDSYFTMLGLVAQGRQDLVEEMVDLFADLIDRFGHVPNGTRSYYLSRSQPPVFYLMVGLSERKRDPRLLRALRREHEYWMSGGRVVSLAGGRSLNRYWDDADRPRDESWTEDLATARKSGRPEAEVWRELRAGAESGWDFTSRWLADGRRLETIRTTRIVPCCLNALLFGLESALAEAGDPAMERAALMRREAIALLNWNEAKGFFADYSMDDETVSDQPTAAMLYPLFTGCADPSAAARTIAAARRHLMAPGGLRTTLVETGQQWDAPNGWAPLQWIACQAFASHGEPTLAQDLAGRWIATVKTEFAATGRMLEKYDVERGGSGDGGEYVTQEGFGWTNGVTAALAARLDSSRSG
ncbi:trehalase family glycosidase [Novosphingobium sp. PS1R-30]|uniref:Trehalase family glycosidase n=1 Tax=Novosphingobium anseongense TaxID=3133436 RepID=A0ABU8RSX9_9SPHN